MNLYKVVKNIVDRKPLVAWCLCIMCLSLGSCVREHENLFEAVGTPDSRSYVDLGLSVRWANCNIGADYPWEYGAYYAWGETYEKDSYYVDNYFCYVEDETNDFGYYYNTLYDEISGYYSYDAAYYHWGSEWRMPTEAEVDELVYNCSWRWTSVRGVVGYMVTGPNGNSIFLPATGYHSGEDKSIDSGWYGYYWCGGSAYDCYDPEDYSLYGDSAYLLGFSNEEGDYDVYYGDRSLGLAIRPVYRY